ncbi:MAG TPA: alanine racemase [Actinomycetota bacterium]|nr:alanine racemase [Actinomycetota bacterium]
MPSTTWVEVSVSALQENLRAVARYAGVPICAVVKANGYGHDAAIAARAFVDAGASMIGVTRLEEARAIRDAGVDAPTLIFMPVPDVSEAVALGCEITVGSIDDIANLPAAARVHLKVDTGMGRIGILPDEALDAARAIAGRATLSGVWTHFADAAGSTGAMQLERFRSVVTSLRHAGIEASAHASNSAAILALPGARFDMVRAGTMLYGQDPAGARVPWTMQDTFAWFARVVAVRSLPAGATVGYGSEWRARDAVRVATLPIGYADGFTLEPNARTPSPLAAARKAAGSLRARGAGRSVEFGERRAPVIGRVGMQAITVSLEGLADIHAGSIARVPARRLAVGSHIPRIPV